MSSNCQSWAFVKSPINSGEELLGFLMSPVALLSVFCLIYLKVLGYGTMSSNRLSPPLSYTLPLPLSLTYPQTIKT